MILIPARILWRTLIEMISGVSCSTIRAISSGPQSTGAKTVDHVDELRRASALSSRRSPQIEHVLVEVVVEIGQERGADGVEGGHDA